MKNENTFAEVSIYQKRLLGVHDLSQRLVLYELKSREIISWNAELRGDEITIKLKTNPK